MSSTSLAGLIQNWDFVPSTPTLLARAARVRTLLTGCRLPPGSSVLRPLTPRSRWNAYFLFLPDGQLSPAHRFTLSRLRALPGGLLAICASPDAATIPGELMSLCDAVYWKGESGFDFSAFGLALRSIAAGSPGADVLLLNDSVLGPFEHLETLLGGTPWQMTGFTGWSAFEHHVQSYALWIRQVTPATIHALRSVFPVRFAFDHFQDVVNWQETRLARVAARTMSVGALWFEPDATSGDPSLTRALALVRAGFPFLKRSLAGGKLAHRIDQAEVRALLLERGHPV